MLFGGRLYNTTQTQAFAQCTNPKNKQQPINKTMAKLNEVMSRLRLNIAVPQSANPDGNEKILRLNHGEYNDILESLRTRVTEIKAKRQQASDKGNELQRKTYGNKEFRFNELIRKLRSAKVMDEATNKDSLSVQNSQTQK